MKMDSFRTEVGWCLSGGMSEGGSERSGFDGLDGE